MILRPHPSSHGTDPLYFEVPGEAAPWLHGSITRQVAEARIEAEGKSKSIEGLYLVRQKDGDENYALSVYEGGAHHHHRIQREPNGWCVNNESEYHRNTHAIKFFSSNLDLTALHTNKISGRSRTLATSSKPLQRDMLWYRDRGTRYSSATLSHPRRVCLGQNRR